MASSLLGCLEGSAEGTVPVAGLILGHPNVASVLAWAGGSTVAPWHADSCGVVHVPGDWRKARVQDVVVLQAGDEKEGDGARQ